MDTLGIASLPRGLTVSKALAMWQSGLATGTMPSETYVTDDALFGAGELHGQIKGDFHRPRTSKPAKT